MRRSLKGTLALAALVAACAIPTEAPNWDVTWNLPLPQEDGPQKIGVQKMLPSGVTLVAPTPPSTTPTAFNANPTTAIPSISRTLGANCPACPTATAPKPAFTAPIATTTISLPTGLASATLAAGSQVVVTIQNNFTFDPIRPPGGANGTVSLAINNGTTTLGQVTLDGATSAIPANATTTITIPLTGTINTSQTITITQSMVSPAGAAGSPVTMNPSQTFVASAAATINVASATVNLGVQAIDSPGEPMDLSSIDVAVANRIADSATTQGSLFLTITTPYTISANATITFTGTREVEGGSSGTTLVPIVPVVKTLVLPAATATQNTFTVPVNLTGQELRRMIGSSLVATFTGNTVAGTTVVTPASEISITGRMQIRLYTQELK